MATATLPEVKKTYTSRSNSSVSVRVTRIDRGGAADRIIHFTEAGRKPSGITSPCSPYQFNREFR